MTRPLVSLVVLWALMVAAVVVVVGFGVGAVRVLRKWADETFDLGFAVLLLGGMFVAALVIRVILS